MKTLFKIAFLALFAVTLMPLSAQDLIPSEVEERTGPMTTIEFSELEYDFGIIQQGEIVERIFTFKNTGDELLIVSNAKGSCGCTVPEWPKEPILPGETASITVRFDSKGKKYKQNKKVTITANTEPAQSFLYMKGEINVPEDGDFEIVDEREEIDPELHPDCFAVYPNPTSEIIQLDMKENVGKAGKVTILSQTGQLMAERVLEELNETEIFSVSHYPAGKYIANVQIEGQKPVSQCFLVMGN